MELYEYIIYLKSFVYWENVVECSYNVVELF